MLDAEGIVETELIAQFKLAPKFFIALMGRHSRFAPDVREMRKLHSEVPSPLCQRLTKVVGLE